MIRYLHLSDLHLTSIENKGPVDAFNQAVVTRSMVDMIRESKFAVDFVVITGDIARMAKPEEYAVCEVFCSQLADALGVDRDRLFLVPGNHDVDRSKITKKHIKSFYGFEDQDEITETLTDPDLFPIFMRKFQAFNAFSEKAMGRRRFDDAAFWYVERLNSRQSGGEFGINLVGLNSCLFAGYDGDEERKLALGLYQIEAALKSMEKGDLSICFFHHPFACFHPEDKVSRNQMMNRFDLILTGHLHDPANAFTRDAAGQALIIGAGAGFETRTSRNSFNLVEIDPETGTGIVQFYKYLPDHNRWKKDTDVNPASEDGCFSFHIPGLIPKSKRTKKTHRSEQRSDATSDAKVQTCDPLESQIKDYKTKIEAFHENLPVIGFKTSLRVPIRIEDVYVPLRAMIDLRATGDSCFADSEDAEKCLKERGEGREISVPDAFKEARRLNRRGIVILGDPGAGKTTHLKRLLIWCLRGGLAKLGLPDDTIPVFLSLRELKNLDIGIDTFIQTQLDQPHLKTPVGFGERLLARGNLLLLFDGLDEVAEPEQRVQVSKWIEDAEKVHRSCRFVVTSRFAGYTPEVQLGGAFIEMHMRPLSEKQAETFIHNWYRSVETGIASDAALGAEVAKKQADEIIRRLKQPEFRARRILAMTRNPLLLTNLCLVHRDRGYLPRNRARLYEECIEVLLELWRGAIGFKGRLTADTGRKILQPVALWLHGKEERTRATAEELKPVIDPALKSVGWRHGSAADFLKIVRDDSGLLTGWDTESYGFMHLGFQEYLAAREIRRSYFKDKGVIQRLADQFGKGWWQEVILLMLALREEPSLFTPFMREVVQRPAFTGHSELVEMCLDDALETSPEPFEELIRADPQKNRDLWERQLYALRILERLNEDAVKTVLESIKNHPSDEIRQWVQERLKQEAQEVIYSDPGGYELVWIPGGKFMMGSTESENGHYDDEEPVHEVHVPGFFMGRYPVTNEEYARFLDADSEIKEPGEWSNRMFNQPQQPVVGVSWHDANQFAEWAGLALPSEAQWEYACRAGSTTRFYSGDSDADLDRVGWYDKNSGGQTHPVGQKEPNPFGLYDMHGNVWEWVEDQWHNSYEGAPRDGSAWLDKKEKSAYRVLRGGSWIRVAEDCRAAYRRRNHPGIRSHDYGFRLALRPGRQVGKQGAQGDAGRGR